MYLAEGSGSGGLLLHVQGQQLYLSQLGEAAAVGEPRGCRRADIVEMGLGGGGGAR